MSDDAKITVLKVSIFLSALGVATGITILVSDYLSEDAQMKLIGWGVAVCLICVFGWLPFSILFSRRESRQGTDREHG